MAQSGLEGQSMYFWGRKLTSFEGSCKRPKALGGGLEGQVCIFWGFEGSCIWPKALGGWAGGSKVSGFGQVCIFWGEN